MRKRICTASAMNTYMLVPGVYLSTTRTNYYEVKAKMNAKKYNWKTDNPDCKVHRANMGPTWVLSAPGWPHVGPRNFAIWERSVLKNSVYLMTNGEGIRWVTSSIFIYTYITGLTIGRLSRTRRVAIPLPMDASSVINDFEMKPCPVQCFLSIGAQN